jgi:hypothetical protein
MLKITTFLWLNLKRKTAKNIINQSCGETGNACPEFDKSKSINQYKKQ